MGTPDTQRMTRLSPKLISLYEVYGSHSTPEFTSTSWRRSTMKQVTALAVFLTLACASFAQTQRSTASATAKTTKRKTATNSNAAVVNQLNELKQAIEAQQQQI